MVARLNNNTKSVNHSGSGIVTARKGEHDTYVKKLAVLQEIRKHAKGKLHIPQVCVLGDQGSGKSSLLSSLVPGLRGVLPTGRGTTTRCPVVVHVAPGETEAVVIDGKRFEIGSPEEKAKAMNTLKNIQVEYLKDAGKRALPEPEYEGEESEDEESTDESEGEESTNGSEAVDNEPPVCDREIMVKYEGPNVVDLVLVDLPGLIHSGPGYGEVEKMARRYIKQRSTFIVIIREADLDKERAAAVKLAAEADPAGERTLQVLTKCDSFSKKEGKEEVIKLISEQSLDVNHPDNLAIHLTCCDRKDLRDAEDALDREDEFFASDEQFKVYRNVGSRDLATRRLPHLLLTCMSGCKASLVKQIRNKLSKSQSVLLKIGREPQSEEAIAHKFCRHIAEVINLQEILSPLLPNFDDASITEKWTDERHQSNKFEPAYYQGLSSFKRCVRDFANEFVEPVATKLCNEIGNELDSLPALLLQDWNEASEEMKHEFEQCWQTFSREALRKLQEATSEKVQDEREFATLNDHYLQSEYLHHLFAPDSVVEDLVRAISAEDVCHLDHCNNITGFRSKSNRTELQKKFTTVLEARFAILEKAESEDFQKHKLHAAVKAYWKVARKRVSDTLTQCVQNEILSKWEHFCRDLSGNQKLKEVCKEPAKVVKCREMMMKLEQDMLECQKRVDAL